MLPKTIQQKSDPPHEGAAVTSFT